MGDPSFPPSISQVKDFNSRPTDTNRVHYFSEACGKATLMFGKRLRDWITMPKAVDKGIDGAYATRELIETVGSESGVR